MELNEVEHRRRGCQQPMPCMLQEHTGMILDTYMEMPITHPMIKRR